MYFQDKLFPSSSNQVYGDIYWYSNFKSDTNVVRYMYLFRTNILTIWEKYLRTELSGCFNQNHAALTELKKGYY